jgi:hypothetical protein
MKKKQVYLILLCAILVAAIFSSGCSDAGTGCVPAAISEKRLYESPNLKILYLTIGDTEYKYYNPSLKTYSLIEPNQTYNIRFVPLAFEKPAVELCKVGKND